MYVSDEVSERVYTVLSVILYMTWLTISALCGSYHDVLADAGTGTNLKTAAKEATS